jgi:probable HAF family extracellular repeat protein
MNPRETCRGGSARLPLIAAAAALLGCSSCGGDHHEPAPAAPAAVLAGRAELRARCTTGVVPPAEGYARIVEIPPLGNGLVFLHDINDDGVAVGSAQVDGGGYHAFRWTERGGITDLGAQPGFGAHSFTSAIASDGAISGQSDHGDGSGTLYGYRWTASGGRVEVCPAGCSVWDLNAAGQVVGLLPGRDTTTWQAFVWSAAAGLRPLGTLGGARSSASGISDAGLVVGNAQLADSASGDVGHAFLYDSRAPHAAIEDLNGRARTPGWVLRGANDVNDAFVVGYGRHDGKSRAFRLALATGAVDDLGTLGSGDSIAWAADTAGDVVGWVAVDRHRNVAFVWSPSLGKMVALGDLVEPGQGWELEQANGINSHGAIVGMATHDGRPVGFQLTLPLCGG